MIATKARVTPLPTLSKVLPLALDSVPVTTFLPSLDDVKALHQNLAIKFRSAMYCVRT